MRDVYLAFDVGGTRIKSGLVDGAGQVARRRIDATEGHLGADSLIDRMIGIGRELIGEVSPDGAVRAIGVAFTGVIDPEAGRVVLLNGKVPDIEGVEVGRRIAAAFGLPCRVDNDTRVYTIGEWRHGAGKGFDNVVCITLGTGIGSGVISHGEVLHTEGLVGGILGGHFTVDCDGPLCSCGNRGCLESVASVPALLTSVRDHLSRGYPSVLAEMTAGDPTALTAEQLVEAARQDDALARFCLDRWTQRVGAGLVTLIHAYDPDVVIIGGGIMHAAETILPPIELYVHSHAWTWPARRTIVRASALGDDAALVGGAVMAAMASGSDMDAREGLRRT